MKTEQTDKLKRAAMRLRNAAVEALTLPFWSNVKTLRQAVRDFDAARRGATR